jgi:serpin B
VVTIAPSATPSAISLPTPFVGSDGIALAQSNAARVPLSLDDARAEGSAISGFGLDLLRRLAGSGGNDVFSPASVALALDMARAGARGTTAAQIDAVLHQAGSAAQQAQEIGSLDQALGSLTQTIENPKGPIQVTVQVANAPFAQLGLALEPTYLEALAAQFGAGLRLVDYAQDPDAARGLINGWVATQTHGRIAQLLGAGSVTDRTRLTLVNTMYLSAPWALQFDPKATQPGSFTRADGSVVRVPMMALTDTQRTLRYAQGPGWQAVTLPYADQALEMTVVLPDDLAQFEAQLTPMQLTQIIGATRPRQVTITMPRFTIATQAELSGALQALGMPLALDPARADFSGITTSERLYISAVVHQATISVDEKGTEASAATAVVMGLMGIPEPLAPATIHVDRPFLFAIQDQNTGAILFMGSVNDPSLKG